MTTIVRTVSDLRKRVDKWHEQSQKVALVPTMGYLHNAHIALIEAGKQICSRTIVSIFVNPRQFSPKEDFEKYPRDEQRDVSLLAKHQVDLAFVPSPEEIYPLKFSTVVSVPSLTQTLCAKTRPNHFSGVATVCAKLFNLCRPDVAVFGEKDYQQLQMIRHLVKDLNIPTEICGVPTVRETDGLAISSRNVYLSRQERARAAQINVILAATATRLTEGHEPAKELANALAQLNKKVSYTVEYVELCDAETLAPITELNTPARLLTAIIINKTRLIDNWPVMPRTI